MIDTTEKDDRQQWLQYIKNRIVLAREWREEFDTHKALATAYRYVRILGRNFRAVSLSSYNPCGRLIRKEDGRGVVGKSSISAAFKSVQDAVPFDDENDFRPGKFKTEHEIQAFIIRYGLMNDLKFGGLFSGFSEEFDDLLFITDELSTGELRADIIALGLKDGRHFPVFIELKNKRQLTRLKEQLEGAKTLMGIARMPFLDMLSAVSGVPTENISYDGYRLMIVWPPSKSGLEDKRVEELRSKDFLFAEFSKQRSGEYEFSRN